jgi:hypothetical protein
MLFYNSKKDCYYCCFHFYSSHIFIYFERTKSKLNVHDGDTDEADHLRDIVKILITYMQILSVLTPTYSSVSWPSDFKSYSEGMSVINFDVAFVFPATSCRFSLPYKEKLYLHLISPAAFFTSVQLALMLTLLLKFKCGENITKERQKIQRNKATKIFLLIMQLMCKFFFKLFFIFLKLFFIFFSLEEN